MATISKNRNESEDDELDMLINNLVVPKHDISRSSVNKKHEMENVNEAIGNEVLQEDESVDVVARNGLDTCSGLENGSQMDHKTESMVPKTGYANLELSYVESDERDVVDQDNGNSTQQSSLYPNFQGFSVQKDAIDQNNDTRNDELINTESLKHDDDTDMYLDDVYLSIRVDDFNDAPLTPVMVHENENCELTISEYSRLMPRMSYEIEYFSNNCENTGFGFEGFCDSEFNRLCTVFHDKVRVHFECVRELNYLSSQVDSLKDKVFSFQNVQYTNEGKCNDSNVVVSELNAKIVSVDQGQMRRLDQLVHKLHALRFDRLSRAEFEMKYSSHCLDAYMQELYFSETLKNIETNSPFSFENEMNPFNDSIVKVKLNEAISILFKWIHKVQTCGTNEKNDEKFILGKFYDLLLQAGGYFQRISSIQDFQIIVVQLFIIPDVCSWQGENLIPIVRIEKDIHVDFVFTLLHSFSQNPDFENMNQESCQALFGRFPIQMVVDYILLNQRRTKYNNTKSIISGLDTLLYLLHQCLMKYSEYQSLRRQIAQTISKVQSEVENFKKDKSNVLHYQKFFIRGSHAILRSGDPSIWLFCHSISFDQSLSLTQAKALFWSCYTLSIPAPIADEVMTSLATWRSFISQELRTNFQKQLSHPASTALVDVFRQLCVHDAVLAQIISFELFETLSESHLSPVQNEIISCFKVVGKRYPAMVPFLIGRCVEKFEQVKPYTAKISRNLPIHLWQIEKGELNPLFQFLEDDFDSPKCRFGRAIFSSMAFPELSPELKTFLMIQFAHVVKKRILNRKMFRLGSDEDRFRSWVFDALMRIYPSYPDGSWKRFGLSIDSNDLQELSEFASQDSAIAYVFILVSEIMEDETLMTEYLVYLFGPMIKRGDSRYVIKLNFELSMQVCAMRKRNPRKSTLPSIFSSSLRLLFQENGKTKSNAKYLCDIPDNVKYFTQAFCTRLELLPWDDSEGITPTDFFQFWIQQFENFEKWHLNEDFLFIQNEVYKTFFRNGYFVQYVQESEPPKLLRNFGLQKFNAIQTYFLSYPEKLFKNYSQIPQTKADFPYFHLVLLIQLAKFEETNRHDVGKQLVLRRIKKPQIEKNCGHLAIYRVLNACLSYSGALSSNISSLREQHYFFVLPLYWQLFLNLYFETIDIQEYGSNVPIGVEFLSKEMKNAVKDQLQVLEEKYQKNLKLSQLYKSMGLWFNGMNRNSTNFIQNMGDLSQESMVNHLISAFSSRIWKEPDKMWNEFLDLGILDKEQTKLNRLLLHHLYPLEIMKWIEEKKTKPFVSSSRVPPKRQINDFETSSLFVYTNDTMLFPHDLSFFDEQCIQTACSVYSENLQRAKVLQNQYMESLPRLWNNIPQMKIFRAPCKRGSSCTGHAIIELRYEAAELDKAMNQHLEQLYSMRCSLLSSPLTPKKMPNIIQLLEKYIDFVCNLNDCSLGVSLFHRLAASYARHAFIFPVLKGKFEDALHRLSIQFIHNNFNETKRLFDLLVNDKLFMQNLEQFFDPFVCSDIWDELIARLHGIQQEKELLPIFKKFQVIQWMKCSPSLSLQLSLLNQSNVGFTVQHEELKSFYVSLFLSLIQCNLEGLYNKGFELIVSNMMQRKINLWIFEKFVYLNFSVLPYESFKLGMQFLSRNLHELQGCNPLRLLNAYCPTLLKLIERQFVNFGQTIAPQEFNELLSLLELVFTPLVVERDTGPSQDSESKLYEIVVNMMISILIEFQSNVSYRSPVIHFFWEFIVKNQSNISHASWKIFYKNLLHLKWDEWILSIPEMHQFFGRMLAIKARFYQNFCFAVVDKVDWTRCYTNWLLHSEQMESSDILLSKLISQVQSCIMIKIVAENQSSCSPIQTNFSFKLLLTEDFKRVLSYAHIHQCHHKDQYLSLLDILFQSIHAEGKNELAVEKLDILLEWFQSFLKDIGGKISKFEDMVRIFGRKLSECLLKIKAEWKIGSLFESSVVPKLLFLLDLHDKAFSILQKNVLGNFYNDPNLSKLGLLHCHEVTNIIKKVNYAHGLVQGMEYENLKDISDILSLEFLEGNIKKECIRQHRYFLLMVIFITEVSRFKNSDVITEISEYIMQIKSVGSESELLQLALFQLSLCGEKLEKNSQIVKTARHLFKLSCAKGKKLSIFSSAQKKYSPEFEGIFSVIYCYLLLHFPCNDPKKLQFAKSLLAQLQDMFPFSSGIVFEYLERRKGVHSLVPMLMEILETKEMEAFKHLLDEKNCFKLSDENNGE